MEGEIVVDPQRKKEVKYFRARGWNSIARAFYHDHSLFFILRLFGKKMQAEALKKHSDWSDNAKIEKTRRVAADEVTAVQSLLIL